VKEKAAEVQRLQKTLNIVEKKLKKSEGELSNKSTLLVGSEELLRTCRKELEKMKNEIGLEELSADLSVC
jgi:valyl-tRNA synthetase